MKVLLTGASGLIGQELLNFLKAQGFTVYCLLRAGSSGSSKGMHGEIYWDIKQQQVDSAKLEGFDAFIHLAGENIAEGRWTEDKKNRILLSRVQSTKLLADTVLKLKTPPKVFISTSAIGYYGDRGEMLCPECTPNGSGFLAEVCRQWEAATHLVAKHGIRTLIMRNGIVLAKQGGVLKKMRIPFLWGLGGNLGSGKQFMSWIAMEDLLHITLFALQNQAIEGALNIVSPHPVRNAEFTKTFAGLLHRPAVLSAPAFMLRAFLGKQKADELLLSSTRALPDQLLQGGYVFRFPNLEQALQRELN